MLTNQNLIALEAKLAPIAFFFSSYLPQWKVIALESLALIARDGGPSSLEEALLGFRVI